jgi:hypothetical protein
VFLRCLKTVKFGKETVKFQGCAAERTAGSAVQAMPLPDSVSSLVAEMGWLRHSSQDVRKERTGRAATYTAFRHYVGPCGSASTTLQTLLSYVPWLQGRCPLLRYDGRSDPDRTLLCRPPWFPDSHPPDFRPFSLQPSVVLDQTRSTPSTLAPLFCSGFAVSLACRTHGACRVIFSNTGCHERFAMLYCARRVSKTDGPV